MRGQCLCDTVSFEILGTMPKLYQCHCSLCRKQGGSVSNTATIVALENFRWRSGEAAISTFVLPTGFRAAFCSNCGTTVPNPLRDTSYMWIPSGMFDSAEILEIVAHLYVGSRASWDTAPLSGKQYDTMPAEQEFIDVLHQRNA